jgi:hypothetical protein
VPVVTETEALERLRAILARPEFREPPRSLWERALAAVGAWLVALGRDLLGRLPDGALAPLGAAQVVAVLVALGALVALGVYVLRGIGLSVAREGRLRAAGGAASRARSDALWAEGQALGRAGRFGEATRALYLSALYALEEHGLVRVEAALTNREHAVRAVRVQPGLAQSFDRLVQRYDRLRYGDYEVDRAAFEEISTLVGRTRESRPSPTGAAPVAA